MTDPEKERRKMTGEILAALLSRHDEALTSKTPDGIAAEQLEYRNRMCLTAEIWADGMIARLDATAPKEPEKEKAAGVRVFKGRKYHFAALIGKMRPIYFNGDIWQGSVVPCVKYLIDDGMPELSPSEASAFCIAHPIPAELLGE